MHLFCRHMVTSLHNPYIKSQDITKDRARQRYSRLEPTAFLNVSVGGATKRLRTAASKTIHELVPGSFDRNPEGRTHHRGSFGRGPSESLLDPSVLPS